MLEELPDLRRIEFVDNFDLESIDAFLNAEDHETICEAFFKAMRLHLLRT